MDLADAKALLRREMRARLAALGPDEIAARSAEIVARASVWPPFVAARAVMLPLPLPGEPDLTPLALAALESGKALCLPRVDWAARAMDAAVIHHLADLVPGRYGLREPPAEAGSLPLDQLDLVLAPGLAFDTAGNRLGRGAGFYDRFLTAAGPAARSCGVCFDLQVVDEVPRGPMDTPVAAVITDQRLILP